MTKLIDAMRTKDTVTENGMPTNSTSLNHCVDLFFHIGAMRGQEKQKKINAFVKAFEENALIATKILFWARDVRGGAGERQTFREIITYMAENRTEVLRKNIHLISEYGRWDDLLVLIGTKLEKEALDLIAEGLRAKNALCAKWMPRPSVKNSIKKMQSNVIRKHMGLSPKEFRQMLAKISNTVEQVMCSGEWDKIKYYNVPSKAMSNYMKAFRKHDEAGFTKYLESLSKGETKINAEAIYPYDILKNIRSGEIMGAALQWEALPNYMENSKERMIPVVDVSGSMNSRVGDNPNISCMDVALSLGLYISERNVGVFQDAFITFSEDPQLQVLKGNISERTHQMMTSDWGMNTNLEAVFKLILTKAKESNVPPSEMPTMIIILSDMQFDECIEMPNSTAFEMIKNMYEESSYEIPKIVFWNLRSVKSDCPVHFNKNGVALVSGFSPSLLTSLLSGKSITPFSMMLDVINKKRYEAITV